ncbi:LemA family protein [Thiotrichales bacterium 19S3-7]|nr:LemA family protein [Thiotrichales bacterium 19S3-7]MCF6801814.1 LemA family protein [Thiotrichales bacterium 19S3-11]
MSTEAIVFSIVGIITIFLMVYIVKTFNRLIYEIEAVNNSERQIDVQLDRRFKLFESLISAVNKYMDHEKTVLRDVAALRSKSVEAKNSGDQSALFSFEDTLSNIAKGFSVQVEAYPDLKANQNVMQLQEEITNTENKLTYSKQAYNDSIEKYNADKKSFFASMVVGLFKSKLNKQFIYWGVSDAKRTTLEEYTATL